MLTRVLAYICFSTSIFWVLFASWLLVDSIQKDPRHVWIQLALICSVLLPSICTALYVYRTQFGRQPARNPKG